MRLIHTSSLILLALALAACGGDKPATGAATPAAGKQPEWTDAARIEAIASTLQACSYEGNPVKVEASQLQGPAPGDCKSMVDKIMGYTGLPANFVVTAGPVPNAAAVILLDDARVPHRVIAFNPDFIRQTQQATGGDTWAPVSIMVHEIGHHLSGHTITAGGSRPDIELEADKFSGYVLQKMGASLAAATKAILTFGTDTDQPTHPSKDKRAAAIGQGWQEACSQVGATNCNAGIATTTPVTTPTPTQPVAIVKLPAPSATSIPFKYGRFVVDETGKLDPAKLSGLDTKLYDLAKTKGLELAVLVVDDLRGMSADDYAWAMMRQLRIGKLDLGNGGVIVIAPNQGKSGAAFAPGVAKALEFFDAGKRFDIYLKGGGWQRGCLGPDGCSGFTDGLLSVVDAQLRSLDTTWEIRFTRIEDVIEASKQALAERRAGRKDTDTSLGSLVRFTGTVTDTAPKPEPLRVNERIIKDGKWRAILVKTEEGQEVTLYVQPRTASVMPSGELKRGAQYTFVGQLNSAGQFHTDQGVVQINPNLWLFSYEVL